MTPKKRCRKAKSRHAGSILQLSDYLFRYIAFAVGLLLFLLLLFQFLLQFDGLRQWFSATERLEGTPYSAASFLHRPL